jgi:hypothetical protein
MVFKNPWGKGSAKHDRWFSDPWDANKTSGLQDETVPIVDSWQIKTAGKTSDDNICENCPQNLGVNSDPAGYYNGIELKVFVLNHKKGYLYNISRIASQKIWELMPNGAWELTGEHKPYLDDRSNRDEVLTPIRSDPEDTVKKLRHLYVQDQPGFSGKPNMKQDAIAVLFLATFEEYLLIKNEQTTKVIKDVTTQLWHSKIYLKFENGTWTWDLTKSEIGAGAISLDAPQ